MIRIGILSPSEIAFRRFLPAIINNSKFEYVGIAIANKSEWYGEKFEEVDDNRFNQIRKTELEKAQMIKDNYGGEILEGYEDFLKSGKLDAVYIPLPPALHYDLAKKALGYGLHVLVEKPSTDSLEKTQDLINIAKEKKLALHENYMFVYHSQLSEIDKVVRSGKIGKIRLYRIDFGFPKRERNDFRYNAALGGGALLDCGGYTLKYASYLLGETTKIVCANSIYSDEFDVDIAGAATLTNDEGQIVQTSFGMDNDYRCRIDIWGSEGSLKSERILTAPVGFVPTYTISKNGRCEVFNMQPDDTFMKSIDRFYDCINKSEQQMENYNLIFKQALLVNEFLQLRK